MRKCTEIPPAPKSAREHSSPGAGLSWAGAMGGQTRKESKQHMDQEQNMGVKIIGQREPKLEKEDERKSFKEGTGGGQLQAIHCTPWCGCVPCKSTELNCFSSSPLWAPTHALSCPIIVASNSPASL